MEGYGNKEAALSFVWFVLWVGIGTFALFAHNLILPYLFLGYAAGTYLSHMYLACTRCYYFGKACYLMGGLLAPKLYRMRKEGPLDPDDSISSTLWFFLGVFPIPFLLYCQDWPFLAAYTVLTYGWFFYRRKLICRKCKNDWCPGKK
jgi:hypothetical protein